MKNFASRYTGRYGGLRKHHFLEDGDWMRLGGYKLGKGSDMISNAFCVPDERWKNGTKINYFFLPGSRFEAENLFRKALKTWKDCGIGLKFRETRRRIDSDVRVAFSDDGDSWSHVGIKALLVPNDEPTIKIGDMKESTFLHETGHMLGLRHSHLSLHRTSPNGFKGGGWNKEEIYRVMSSIWSKELVDNNFFRRFRDSGIKWTEFDGRSIMCYPIESSFLGDEFKKKYVQYREGIPGGETLSNNDKRKISSMYPPISVSEGNNGLNLEFVCRNPRCPKKEHVLIRPFGFGKFDVIYDVKLMLTKCPECKHLLGEKDCLGIVFSNCSLEYEYIYREDRNMENKREKRMMKVKHKLLFQTQKSGRYKKLVMKVEKLK